MKAAADFAKKDDTDFYLANLAPVDHPRDRRFAVTDAIVLGVLFVEILFLMRLFLAT